MKRFLSIIIALLCMTAVCHSEDRFVIKVNTQAEYDALALALKNAVAKHSDVLVTFGPGVFLFNDTNKISLSNTKAKVAFEGVPGTVLQSDGEVYKIDGSAPVYNGKWHKVKVKSPIDKYCTFLDQNGERVFVSDTGYLNDTLRTNISLEKISIVDEEKGIAKIRIPAELNAIKNKPKDYFYGSVLVYKSQWSDAACEVLYSDKNYIYFQLDEFLKGRVADYVVNMFNFSGRYYHTVKSQPFYVTNILAAMEPGTVAFDEKYLYVPENVTELKVLRYGKFASFKKCTGGLSFKGIAWSGSSFGKYIQSRNYYIRSGNGLMLITDCRNVTIEDCRIIHQGHGLIGPIYNTSDISISGCEFLDNYDDNIVESLGGVSNMIFTGNRIHNSHQFITCRMALYMTGDVTDIVVSGNEASDLTRTLFFYLKGKNVLIENNVLHNTAEFNKYPRRNMSSDTGVLVYSTGGYPITIRNNVVYDLPRNFNYSGVMVDNGTGKAVIEGNLMFSIGDHTVNCWKNGGDKPICLGNKLIGNVLVGNTNFGGFDSALENNAYYSGNIFAASNRSNVLPQTKATDGGGNVYLSSQEYKVENGKVFLPRKLYRRLSGTPLLKEYIVKK